MKKSSLIAVFFVLCLGAFTILMPLTANANLFEIISTYQSIGGNAYSNYAIFDDDGNYIGLDFNSDFFADSSSTPTNLSGSVSNGGYATAYSNLSIGENGFGGAIGAYSSGRSMMGAEADSDASSSLVIVFRVNELSKWQFSYIVDPPTDCQIHGVINTLIDPVGFYELTLSPLVDYQISMDGWSWQSQYDASFDANGTPIPEPATILLLGLGLIGLAGVRRKIKR